MSLSVKVLRPQSKIKMAALILVSIHVGDKFKIMVTVFTVTFGQLEYNTRM